MMILKYNDTEQRDARGRWVAGVAGGAGVAAAAGHFAPRLLGAAASRSMTSRFAPGTVGAAPPGSLSTAIAALRSAAKSPASRALLSRLSEVVAREELAAAVRAGLGAGRTSYIAGQHLFGKAGYDPGEARDERGKWTAAATGSTGSARAVEHLDTAVHSGLGWISSKASDGWKNLSVGDKLLIGAALLAATKKGAPYAVGALTPKMGARIADVFAGAAVAVRSGNIPPKAAKAAMALGIFARFAAPGYPGAASFARAVSAWAITASALATTETGKNWLASAGESIGRSVLEGTARQGFQTATQTAGRAVDQALRYNSLNLDRMHTAMIGGMRAAGGAIVGGPAGNTIRSAALAGALRFFPMAKQHTTSERPLPYPAGAKTGEPLVRALESSLAAHKRMGLSNIDHGS